MYILISASILAASLNSSLLHTIPSAKQKNVFSFNFFCSVIWIIILTLFNKGQLNLSDEVIFWGTLYGITQVLFLVFKTKAMSSGPVSVTTLIGNCSLLLSTSVSVIAWHESISILQIAGITVLLLSVFLCSYSKSENASQKNWRLYSTFFFIFAAAVGIVFKCFSKSASKDNVGDMMLTAAVVMSVILFILSAFKEPKNKRKQLINFDRRYIFTIIGSGALSCLYNRLNITLSGRLPGAFFFPAFNGGTIVLSALLARFLLKENITKKQAAGLILGTISIIIIGIF